jgi:hypothetical protein
MSTLSASIWPFSPLLLSLSDRDLVAGVDDRLDLRADEDVDAEVLVLLRDLLRDIRVLVRERAVEELDDRDLHAVVRQDVRELHADRAGADDDDRAGQVAREDLLLVGDDVLAQRDAGEQAHGGAGRDDDVVEGDLFGRAVRLRHRDRLGARERPAALVLGDLVLLHQVVDALDAPVGDDARAVERRAEVGGELARDAEEVGLVLQGVHDLGVLQERLGGDAADVEAHTAPVLLFDDRDGLTELRGADRCDIATGAGAEDDDVVMRHASSLVLAALLVRGHRGRRLRRAPPRARLPESDPSRRSRHVGVCQAASVGERSPSGRWRRPRRRTSTGPRSDARRSRRRAR